MRCGLSTIYRRSSSQGALTLIDSVTPLPRKISGEEAMSSGYAPASSGGQKVVLTADH